MSEVPVSTTDGLGYIRDYYRVPAQLDGRIRWTYSEPKLGTIVGSNGPHLLVQFDGEKEPDLCHPTWEIEYLDAGGSVAWSEAAR
jgi:hypothetical protein